MIAPDVLDNAARTRTTLIVKPSAEDGDTIGNPARVGALVLGRLDPAHLARGEACPDHAWLAVAWAGWFRLQVIRSAWPNLPDQGRPLEVPALDLRQRITADEHGPRAVLEALALVVRFGCDADVWRRTATGNERRRIRAAKLGLRRQILTVHDLDRDAARSFHLADLVAVELHPDAPLPVWGGEGYQVAGAGA